MKDSADLELSHETMERIFNQLFTKTLLTMRTSKIVGLKETFGTHLSKKDREQCEVISPCIHCFCRDHHAVNYFACVSTKPKSTGNVGRSTRRKLELEE